MNRSISIPIQDISAEMFRLLLEFIYLDELEIEKIEADKLPELLISADRFSLIKLKVFRSIYLFDLFFLNIPIHLSTGSHPSIQTKQTTCIQNQCEQILIDGIDADNVASFYQFSQTISDCKQLENACSFVLNNKEIPLNATASQKDLKDEEKEKYFQEQRQTYLIFRKQVLDSIDLKHLTERQMKEKMKSWRSRSEEYFY